MQTFFKTFGASDEVADMLTWAVYAGVAMLVVPALLAMVQ